MPETLVDLVAEMAARDPVVGVTVYDRRVRHATTRSHAEMARRARCWASWLGERGVQPGEVLFLCLPTSLDLIEVFLGASLLRALPCCLALPRAVGGLESFRSRVAKASERFPGGHLVTTPDVGAELGRPHFTVPDDLEAAGPAELTAVDPASLAYLQLTSGSTRSPKAVAITHANLAANTQAISSWGGHGHHPISWLPLYHDMGLVGMTLTPLMQGYGHTLMPPEAFVGSPLRWLQAISAHDGPTSTTAPNFGYQWCVDRIPAGKEEQLDLSNLTLALVGSEMVRPATLDQFERRFAARGFRRQAFKPCYGMAESTLAVTCTPRDSAPKIHHGRVSAGLPLEGITVRIQQPGSGEALPEGEEGEVMVGGSSVFEGYYLDEPATSAVLDSDGSLHTGDLGFLHEGELYLTGRLKDLLILDGVNVAPYELEWLAQDHLPMEGGRAAGFGVEVDGRERAVLVVEVKAVPPEQAMVELARRVGSDFAPLHELVLVRRGTLPKTSSGKVQRQKIKTLYESDGLEAVLWRSTQKAERT